MEAEIAVLHPGDFFGELSLLGGARRTATATAVEATSLLVIRRDTFAMMMQDDLEVVFRMMDALGARLAVTDRQIHDLLHARGRARIAADLLGAYVTGDSAAGGVPLDELSRGWGISPKSLGATVDDLVGRGAGTVEGGRWRARGSDDVSRLVAALRAYLR
jgi:CRP-like cAMP-binding protein